MLAFAPMSEPDPDRFERRVVTARDGASFAFCLHGGHLLSFVPAGGREALFVSPRARFETGAAIRGGVPVIFPQFSSNGPLPTHGFARTSRFRLDASGVRDDGAAFARLVLDDDALAPRARELFPFRFHLAIELVAAGATLTQSLVVENRDRAPFGFTGALHTYFAVDDVRTTELHGLDGAAYFDKALDREGTVAGALRFPGEVDRVCRSSAPIAIDDGKRTIALSVEGFCDWVVWNPGDAKAAALADLGADAGRRFVCAEAAVVSRPVELAPGGVWCGRQTIEVRRDPRSG